MAIIFQTILVIAALVLLFRLMIWFVPVLAGIGLGCSPTDMAQAASSRSA